mgnify:CR=1 FL=1
MLQTTTEIPSPVTEYYNRGLLERALPFMNHDLFGQIRPLPQKGSKIAKFRRYESLGTATTPLSEGVPPSSTDPSYTDVTATVATYGSYIEYSDDVELTSPDPLLTEFNELLGEQSGETIDILRRDVLVTGTNVAYQTGTARASQNAALTLATLRTILRTMERNKVRYITSVLSGSPNVGSDAIPMSFVAIIHPDTAFDVRQMSGFVGIEDYGQMRPIHESEIGALPAVRIRFLINPNAKKWTGAGQGSTTMVNTTSVADVYGTLIFGMNAFGIVPLRGAALTTHLKARGTGGTSDPLDQVGTIGWKAKTTTKILNDNFLMRVEHAASLS